MRQQANRAARAALVLAAAVAVVAVAFPAAAGSVDAGAAFDTLKSLEGHWTGTAAGNPGGEVVYEVVSGGNTVMERMFPGTDNEMISMYHMDGDDLVMVHYCDSGNQPKLKLVSTDGGALRFDFVGGTNLDPAKDTHIHGARIRMSEDGTLEEAWIGYAGGQQQGEMVMELTRQAE